MGSTVRIGSLTAVVDHLEAQKNEVNVWGGPQVVQRGESGPGYEVDQAIGNWIIDTRYPFAEAGDVKSWSFFQSEAGLVDIGTMHAIILRSNAGVWEVKGVMPMTVVHTGVGVWFHEQVGVTAVLAGDRIGIAFASAPPGSGIIPRYSYDTIGDNTIGIVKVLPTVFPPVIDNSYSGGGTPLARRASFQAMGDVLGAWVDIDTASGPGLSKGSGAFQPDFAPGSPTGWVVDTTGALTNEANLFNYDPTQTANIPALYAGDVILRLVSGANTVPV